MKRLVQIDHMRGVGIVLVVLVHSFGYVRSLYGLTLPAFWVLENWLHTFLMPFFVFVSGYSFATFYKNRRQDMKRIQSYLSRLLQIYLLFGTSIIAIKVIFASETVDKISPNQIIQNIFLPDTSMWYIWFLIIMTFVLLLKFHYTSQSVSQSLVF